MPPVSDHQFSVPVDVEEVRASGTFTILSVRLHKDEALAIAGSDAIERDWTKAFGRAPFSDGCRSQYGHLAALSLPESIPERLEVCAYIMDYMLHHDDIADLDMSQAKKQHSDLDAALKTDPTNRSNGAESAKKNMQAQIMLKLMQIDKPAAIALVAEWSRYASISAKTTEMTFSNFEEYKKQRYFEAAIPLYFEIQCFATGVRLSEAEKEGVSHIITPLGTSMALINDYYSFDKEYNLFAETNCAGQMYNAIAYLVVENSLSIHGAKEALKEKIMDLEKEFMEQWESWSACEERPVHVQRYIQFAALTAAGSSYWHSRASRYTVSNPLSKRDGAVQLLKQKSLDRPMEIGHYQTPPPRETQKVRKGLQNGGFAQTEIFENSQATWEPLQGPFEYMQGLPSKNVRNLLADAFNIWLQVPEQRLQSIKDVISMLHNASLMLDDIEDGSKLRRGKPSAYVVYGEPQTINTASYLIVKGMTHVQAALKPEVAHIYTQQLTKLHLGQSWDIEWRDGLVCPSEAEYMQMVDMKTGALFELLVQMMQVEGTAARDVDFSALTTLFGRYFQVRDDYQNLASVEYAEKKGFCEDLDEGKFSLPLIYTLKCSTLACKIMQSRRRDGMLSLEVKTLMLKEMSKYQALQTTKSVLLDMEEKIWKEIASLEVQAGEKNAMVGLLLARLKV